MSIGAVGMLARRWMVRRTPAAAWLKGMVIGLAVAIVVGIVVVALGLPSFLAVGVVAVGAMLLVAGVTLLVVPVQIAVAILGIAIACASLTTTLAVTSGFRTALTQAATTLSGHVTLTKYGHDFYEYEQRIAAWSSDPRIVAASPFAYSMVVIVGPVPSYYDLNTEGGTSQANAGLERTPVVALGKGIDPERIADVPGFSTLFDHHELAALRPGSGFSRADPGIVLGWRLAQRLGVEIGEHVRVVVPGSVNGTAASLERPPRAATFEVLDLMHTGMAEYDRAGAFMHLSAAQSVFWGQRRVTGIEFVLTDVDLATSVAAEMEEGFGFPYRAAGWRETHGTILIGIDRIRAFLIVILGMMVLIASVALVSTLLILIRQQRRAIAILMAMGGSRATVFWAFEAIGLLVAVSGAVLGTGLSLLYCWVVARFRFPLHVDVYPIEHLPVALTWVDLLVPPGIALVVCAVVTGPVAVLATRIGVIDALKR